jgi:hypothetical protein
MALPYIFLVIISPCFYLSLIVPLFGENMASSPLKLALQISATSLCTPLMTPFLPYNIVDAAAIIADNEQAVIVPQSEQ